MNIPFTRYLLAATLTAVKHLSAGLPLTRLHGAYTSPIMFRKNLACLAAAGALLLQPVVARADCFDEAAQYHSVNPWILRAIAAQESGFKPATVVRNTDGSVDRGMTGINSVHLPELSKYGVTASDLFDTCKSIYLAGWHLRNKVNRYGNTWQAVGAYHSKTPHHRDGYAAKIQRIIEFWASIGVMPRQPAM